MDPILGQIILWPLNWVPEGWLACNGQELPIQSNAALYSLLGTTYGGNGSTTFRLPDLRNRVPVGVNTGPEVGQTGGSSTKTVTVPLPPHTHTLSTAAKVTSDLHDSSSAGPYLVTSAVSGAANTAGTGATVAVDVTNPYLKMQYIIATVGVYPMRP